jgi:hypothetical protein
MQIVVPLDTPQVEGPCSVQLTPPGLSMAPRQDSPNDLQMVVQVSPPVSSANVQEVSSSMHSR